MPDPQRSRDAAEAATAGLLAVATLASAWCAYQSALWSGEQTRELAKANSEHFASLRKSSEANVAVLVDVTTFIDYIKTEARADTRAGDFIRQHARSEFRPILERWIEDHRGDQAAGETPFGTPLYKLAALEQADEFDHQADAATQGANQANGHSDMFVLHTVAFAMALFFLGSASSARHRGVRRAMFTLGSLVLTLAIVSMVRLPRAPADPRPAGLRS